MRERLLPLTLSLLALVGCKSMSAPAGESAGTVEQTSVTAVANDLPTVEGEFQMDGHFHHAPSGTHFPSVIGGFERTSAHLYSTEQDNFSFRYLPAGISGGLKIDVYVYPRTDETSFVDTDQWLGHLGDQMGKVIGGMKHHYTDVVVVDVVGYDAPTAVGKLLWLVVEATYLDEGVPTTSWAYIAAHKEWFYKMRISTDSTRAETGRKLQKHFFDGFAERLEVRSRESGQLEAHGNSRSPI